MNKPYMILGLIVFIFLLILYNCFKNLETFNSKVKEHSRDTCKYPYTSTNLNILGDSSSESHFPFDNDECDIYNDSHLFLDIHVNNDKKNVNRNIHSVDPYNPCCLRSCINDFTKVEPEKMAEIKRDRSVYKYIRNDFRDTTDRNKLRHMHYFFTSKCNECLKNHYDSVMLLKNAKKKCP